MTYIRLVSIIGVMAFVAVACSDSGGSEPSAASPSSSSTTSSSTTTSTAEVASTTTSSPPFIRADGCHEGSSDATFDDQAGVYATYLTDIDPAAPSLSFDVIQWLVGEDAAEAYRETYPDDPYGPPNDYVIENENPAVRTAPVADDVVVRLVRMDEDADADLDPGTFDELPDYLAGQLGEEGYLSFNPYWLAFDSGEITGICEQFIP